MSCHHHRRCGVTAHPLPTRDLQPNAAAHRSVGGRQHPCEPTAAAAPSAWTQPPRNERTVSRPGGCRPRAAAGTGGGAASGCGDGGGIRAAWTLAKEGPCCLTACPREVVPQAAGEERPCEWGYPGPRRTDSIAILGAVKKHHGLPETRKSWRRHSGEACVR